MKAPYQQYLEELLRLKRESCIRGDHNWTRAYLGEPYCSKCGVDISKVGRPA